MDPESTFNVSSGSIFASIGTAPIIYRLRYSKGYDGSLRLRVGSHFTVMGFKSPYTQVRILPCVEKRIASGLEIAPKGAQYAFCREEKSVCLVG